MLSWLVFLILDIVKYSNTPFAGRLGMDIIILTATAFITYSSYSLKLYKSWNNVIHFSWAFLVALQGINLSTYDYVMNTEVSVDSKRVSSH